MGTARAVVAIVRDSETITDFDPDSFEFQSGDEVIVAGTDDSTTEFESKFGS